MFQMVISGLNFNRNGVYTPEKHRNVPNRDGVLEKFWFHISIGVVIILRMNTKT